MIRIKNNLHPAWYEVKATIFPDGTSQVWKLPEWFLHKEADLSSFKVKWNFESESELLHLIQLSFLLHKTLPEIKLFLKVPYLPYARQDKPTKNDATFALMPMQNLLLQHFYAIEAFDVHNLSVFGQWGFVNSKPIVEINKAIKEFNPTHLFFPDAGALTRYSSMFSQDITFLTIPKLIGNKVRDQATGNITGYEIEIGSRKDLSDTNILIIDDICDGGATFINAAKKLKEKGAGDIGLYVSHGIFSKGKQVLYDAGIVSIYTTNSLVKNTEGYEV